MKSKKRLSIYFYLNTTGIFTEEEKHDLYLFEHRKNEILEQEEISWRLKSRATWAALGDGKNKFFHNYASDRRNRNAIWDIIDEARNVAKTQDELKKATECFSLNILLTQVLLGLMTR